MSEPILEIVDLKKHFATTSGPFTKSRGAVKAVDGVSLTVMPGETVGLVGESGCGKTTVGRTVMKLYQPTSGQIFFDGEEITHQKTITCVKGAAKKVVKALNPKCPAGYKLKKP